MNQNKIIYCVALIFMAVGSLLSQELSRTTDLSTDLIYSRLSDEMTICITENELTLYQEITASSTVLADNLQTNARSYALISIWPILVKKSNETTILFKTLNPMITVSDGKVCHVRYRNYGDEANDTASMTNDGIYRFEIEFESDRDIPPVFTVVIAMTRKINTADWDELLIKMANNDQSDPSPKPDSKFRVLDNHGTLYTFLDGEKEIWPNLKGWINADLDKYYRIKRYTPKSTPTAPEIPKPTETPPNHSE